MKSRKFSLALLPALVCCVFFCSAQVKTRIYRDKLPDSFSLAKKKDVRKVHFNLPAQFTSLKENAKRSPANAENRFAYPITTAIDILKDGLKETGTGYTTYALTVHADSALNISVQFNEFILPENSILSIFTDREITDGITDHQNNKQGVWATKVYQGSSLNFVFKVPTASISNAKLKINRINAGFKPYGYDFGNVGASANCHINANCPEGNGWDPEKNAVALIVADGNEACTGSLIMNTCGTNIPYFLTANHCLAAGNVSNWVFQFQTWSTACNANTGWIETVQFNGCQLRANNAASDFALLELNTTPASTSGLNYAGWSRQTTGNTSTTVIHHPQGDLMKITGDNDAPTAVTDVTDISRDCWELDFDFGHVEQGSSGAPYFNQDHRIIGQHFRRPDAGVLPICSITVARGGRFDASWTGGGTNSTRLSNWLDPGGLNPTTTNTTDVSSLLNVPGMSISGPDLVCSGTQTYTLTGVPSGTTVVWSGSPSYVASMSPSGTSCDVTMNTSGAFTLTASVTAVGCSSVSKVIHFGTYGSGDYQISGPYSAGCYSYVTYSCPSLPGVTSYSWFYPSGWSYVSGLGTNTLHLQTGGTNGYFQVGVRANNTCGTGGSYSIQGTYVSGCSYFRLSPNPALSSVNIAPAEAQSTTTAKGVAQQTISTINIYDQNGLLKKRRTFAKVKNATLNIADLAPGSYVIEIIDGIFKETQILQVVR